MWGGHIQKAVQLGSADSQAHSCPKAIFCCLGNVWPGSHISHFAALTILGMPNIMQKEIWFYHIRLRNYEFSSLQHMPAPGAPHFAIRPMTSSFL
ncbi:hypothetical protein PRIPAC_73739 [Pristionchus pacificus]|uniref:Uncharacterized protein n=1 Tax=Pristionchus pacificus TaxID=54126 RepID=A0A2A6C934_PRIPA|nr:hypothetical protein PRIPAC_73739 [Pristionchus pacificus]|eukprot:PDM74588.1 hypothetical protein PRIPAC_41944 [Pristionchus pacificus]